MPRGLLTRVTHVTVSRPTSGLGCNHRHPLDPRNGNNDLPSVDIDTASDNTGLVDESDREEVIERSDDYPGKVILLNNDDDNSNGTPDDPAITGSLVARTGQVSLIYGFTGQETDAESDLMYYDARYYDPRLGRFVSEDPIGFAALDTNLYRYTANNPINYVDPMGLENNWHHLIPQSCKKYIIELELSINIDSEKYGWILDKKYHLKNKQGTPGGPSIHPGWENDWRDFFVDKDSRRRIKRTEDEVFDFLNKMKRKTEYSRILKNGKAANISYKAWKRGIREVSGAIAQLKKAQNGTRTIRILKSVGKGAKVLAIITIAYNASTGGVTYAAEEGAKDLAFPIPEIMEAAASVTNPIFDAAIECKKERLQASKEMVHNIAIDPANAEIKRAGETMDCWLLEYLKILIYDH